MSCTGPRWLTSRFRGGRVLAPLLLAAIAVEVPGQLSDFQWTYSGDPAGWGSVDATGLHVTGPAWDLCTTFDMFGHMTTSAALSGSVTAHVYFDNQDGGFGWWAAEDPVYVINGEVTYLGPGDFFEPWEGDVTFQVEAGDLFGFGVQTIDCSWGPGLIDVTQFTFTPDVWQDLGQGLAGAYGVPPLNGLGSLQPGAAFTLSLVDVLEDAPAWLVLGLDSLYAPFKGGVLVPDPGSGSPLLLSTGPTGRIIISGTWPTGLPSGISLFMQYWITDPAGPLGWCSSNGVQALLP